MPAPVAVASATTISSPTPIATPTQSPSSEPSPSPTVAPSASAPRVSLRAKCAGSGNAAGASGSPFYCVPILEYHRIVPPSLAGRSLPGLVVSPHVFAAQMAALRTAGWNTITLATLASDMAAGHIPPAGTFVLTIDDGWYDGFKYALPILQADDFVATFFVVSSRIGQAGFLSGAQLKELIADGNEIGNHTVDHTNLTRLGRAAMEYQVDTASDQIQAATGIRPRSFAYPDGGIDRTAYAAVSGCAGMKIAVTQSRRVGLRYSARFEAPRLEITPDLSPASLLARMRH
jgi:peptidoglycan/xylan/chitin deacetylase (PgdA/CDA1 family)